MSNALLRKVVLAHKCRSTHHYIAMEALSLMTGEHADGWRDLLLALHDDIMRGAKAPDETFKDFKNHVLHISEGEWGGARDAANTWYARAVMALREKKWAEGAYALGVMSHYFADPVQPFHTAQTEAEGTIHRALEWSIAKSRAEIARRIDDMGYPEISAGTGPGFVSDLVRKGAELSNPYYQVFIDHYDLERGIANPPDGLDETLLNAVAKLVAFATAGCALLFSRAAAEAGVVPKKVNISVRGYLATLDVPIEWVAKKLDDADTRRTVLAMHKEYLATGKVVKSLPDDDKAIRKLHASEVRRMSLRELDAEPAAETGTKHVAREADAGERPKRQRSVPAKRPRADAPKKPVFRLSDPDVKAATAARDRITRDSDVERAPSIGSRTAKRLNRAGVITVGDLLDAEPDTLAMTLAAQHIDGCIVRDWQDQTRLQMAMPHLRVHDVEMLVGSGIRSPEALAAASARDLLKLAKAQFAELRQTRTIDADLAPDEKEVGGWISAAKKAVG